MPANITQFGDHLAEWYTTEVVYDKDGIHRNGYGVRSTEMVSLHEVPEKLVSDRGYQFTSCPWQSVYGALDARLNISIMYRPDPVDRLKKINELSLNS